jgi:hypothetical protein
MRFATAKLGADTMSIELFDYGSHQLQANTRMGRVGLTKSQCSNMTSISYFLLVGNECKLLILHDKFSTGEALTLNSIVATTPL